MKMTLLTKPRLFTLLVVGVCTLAYGDLAKMEVVVVDDETGLPMTNVTVKGVFPINNGWLGLKGATPPNTDIQKTDANGRCRLSGETNTQKAWCEVVDVPPGYYKGAARAFGYKKSRWGVLRPDDQIGTIRVARMKSPIPLYVKQIGEPGSGAEQDFFALGGGKLQLDLFKGDFLPPAGTGEVADIEFERMPREDLGEAKSDGDGTMVKMWRESMKTRFLGDGNGWVEVKPECYPLAIRTSPDHGFVQEYGTAWETCGRNKKFTKSKQAEKFVCFRIRTKTDENGKVIGGYYGKIYEDIDFQANKDYTVVVATPCFLYYLNPNPLDRNLEWDGVTNLFPGPRVEALR